MKSIINKKLTLLLAFVFSALIFAQTPPEPGTEGEIGDGTSPINMYVVWLFLIAVAFIFATYKHRRSLKNI